MKTILLAILGMLLGFLASAFYNVSFDISQWSPDCRFVTILTMLFGVGLGGFVGGLLGDLK